MITAKKSQQGTQISSLFSAILLQLTYGAVPDVQKHLLSLLGPTDYIREAGSFLRCHTVMWESALESCTLHTYNKKTSSLQALQRNTTLPSQCIQPGDDTVVSLMGWFHLFPFICFYKAYRLPNHSGI